MSAPAHEQTCDVTGGVITHAVIVDVVSEPFEEPFSEAVRCLEVVSGPFGPCGELGELTVQQERACSC